ncbi:MAG: GNAT family N-acetyltransferase [Bryobacteraceae bacterium]|nr:GNAT family N-acetyltransferase [Bryobacteraceae bacterium]
MDWTPVTLTGRHVRLEPLSPAHEGGLLEIGLEPDIWKWTASQVADAAGMANYIAAALREQEAGESIPFAVIDLAGGKVAGCSRYMSIARAHRRLEIGSTWYGLPWQRTAVNTESKYLLLRHAFEALGCLRVEFKTDVLNERSRKAIARLGAKEEGIFRKHMITASGRVRDSVWFSITDEDWPAVKARLQEMLANR